MYKIIAVIVIWLCSITIVGWLSYRTGVDKEATKFIKYRQQQQTLVLEQQEQHKVKLTEQLKDKEDAIKSINKRHATIVSGLRQRTERPVTDPTVKEANSAPVCTGTGSTGEQLYRQDAEFLIGEAAKADILREALKTCRTQLSEQ